MRSKVGAGRNLKFERGVLNMSKLNQRLLGLVGAAFIAALTPVAAEAGTVVAVSGPSARSYPVGTQISNTQRITLRSGDTVSVLDNGGTRVLRGPGTFMLGAQSSRAGSNAFAALTTQRAAVRARTGATRDPNNTGEPSNPNLYYVDLASAGTVCLPMGDKVVFWRKDTTSEAEFAVSGSDGAAFTLSFPEKEMIAAMPDDQALAGDAVLTISGPALEQPTRINFVWLEAAPAEVEEAAQAFIANGCMAQLAQLTSAMSAS